MDRLHNSAHFFSFKKDKVKSIVSYITIVLIVHTLHSDITFSLKVHAHFDEKQSEVKQLVVADTNPCDKNMQFTRMLKNDFAALAVIL